MPGGSDPPDYGRCRCRCRCRCRKNSASTVAAGERHLAVERGGRWGRIHHRHRWRKRESGRVKSDRTGELGQPGGGGSRRCRGRGLPPQLGEFGSHTLRSSGPQVNVAALPADSGQENQRRGDARPRDKINIGWSAPKISPLPGRRLQCFRCMESGYVRRYCTSTVDWSERCYRCGAEGHRARDCSARVPKCPVCTDLGLPASHRMGSPACKPPDRKKRAAQEARAVTRTAGTRRWGRKRRRH